MHFIQHTNLFTVSKFFLSRAKHFKIEASQHQLWYPTFKVNGDYVQVYVTLIYCKLLRLQLTRLSFRPTQYDKHWGWWTLLILFLRSAEKAAYLPPCGPSFVPVNFRDPDTSQQWVCWLLPPPPFKLYFFVDLHLQKVFYGLCCTDVKQTVNNLEIFAFFLYFF